MAGFFSHATAPPRDTLIQPDPMSNATRYLCAAGYLYPSFANTVIKNLVGSHRAVVPSRGIDLIPILRHCLKARRMQLVRDTILSVLLVLGVIVAFPALFLVLVVSFLLMFLPDPQWQRKRLDARAIGGAAAVGMGAIVMVIVGIIAFFLLLSYVSSHLGNSYGGGGLPIPTLLNAGFFGWSVFIVLIAIVLVAYSYQRMRTLGEWLRPGAAAPAFERSSERVENRLAEIDSAQHGNLVLYSGADPFLGTGWTPLDWHRTSAKAKTGDRAWSLAIELVREGTEPGLLRTARQGAVTIDPVELQDTLRRRLLRLNDPDLAPNERLTHISVDDHVVGEGRFEWTSQLVDQARKIPFSQVSRDAIEALIRNPQARLRYYQRISISDEGQTVLAHQQPVIGSVDQEVVVSAFVHVAVEGHMLYLQFVPTALPPIGDEYHVIDTLPKLDSTKFLLRVALAAARGAFGDLVGSPYHTYRALRTMWKEWKDFKEEMSNYRDFVFADIGAVTSVRELGARPGPRTFIQELDQTKYTQIVERLVLDTVLDFLVEKGVDTDAYRASAQMIYNSGVLVGGDVAENARVRNR